MAFFTDHVIVSTIASMFLIWFVSKTVALLKDRQRVKKFVGYLPLLVAHIASFNCHTQTKFYRRSIVVYLGFVMHIIGMKEQDTNIFQSGPPMHPILGHLIAAGKVAMKLPGRAHPHNMAAYMMREYDLPPVFFLDTRPASVLNLIVADP
jgi:hypothetical protein